MLSTYCFEWCHLELISKNRAAVFYKIPEPITQNIKSQNVIFFVKERDSVGTYILGYFYSDFTSKSQFDRTHNFCSISEFEIAIR